MKPSLSIIIPFYNVEAYIEKCLESIAHQTYHDFEVILVNDGTKDDSQKIVDRFVAGDSRFHCYKKKNGGLSDARNYGMKQARGTYIAFLDSDDYVDLDLYEKMMGVAVKTGADVVEADFIWEYDDHIVIDRTRVKDLDHLLLDLRVVAWNKVYRRKLIDSLQLTFSLGLRYEDVDWCYKMVPSIQKIEHVSDSYIHYIQRNTSIANTQNEKVRDIYTVLENTITYYKEHGLYDTYEKQLEYIFIRYIFGSSFLRTLQVPDRLVSNKILKEGYQLLLFHFPKWHYNPYLRRGKMTTIVKNMYYFTMNRVTYPIYIKIHRMMNRYMHGLYTRLIQIIQR